MGWDIVGGLRDAAGWVNDKIDEGLDSAGHAIDSGVHGAEHAIDGARQSINDFGQRHGGVVGSAVAHQVTDAIGVAEGAGLAVYDAAAGVTTLARGAGHLVNPVEWATHPQKNLDRLSAAGHAAETLSKLADPVEWAFHSDANAAIAKSLWNGVTAGYQDAAKNGDWAKVGGRALVDIGSFFIGAGEVNAGVKGAEGANALTHAADGLAALDHGADGLNAAGHAADALGSAARDAEALGGAARLTEMARSIGQNSFKWSVDAEGHTVAAEATLKEVFDKAPRSSAERAAQGAAGRAGEADDVGGHILGHRFVKDQGSVNMFPQNTQFNNGAYRTMENEWADWVKQGKQVDVQISFSGGTPTRPDRVNVRYEVTDPASGELVYSRAKPFNNEAGQTFDRVPKKDMQ
jgi:hypothetical protein